MDHPALQGLGLRQGRVLARRQAQVLVLRQGQVLDRHQVQEMDHLRARVHRGAARRHRQLRSSRNNPKKYVRFYRELA